MLYKNLKPKHLFPIAIIRFFMDYLAALVFMFKGDFSNANAVRRARWDFIKMKSRFRAKRKANLEVSIAKSIPSAYKGSIVFEYYILRRRTIKC